MFVMHDAAEIKKTLIITLKVINKSNHCCEPVMFFLALLIVDASIFRIGAGFRVVTINSGFITGYNSTHKFWVIVCKTRHVMEIFLPEFLPLLFQ